MIKIYSYAYFSKKRKKRILKKISLVSSTLLIVQMTIGGLFFSALPMPEARATSGNLCSTPVDVVMVLDRSGSMNFTSRCDWWEHKCLDKPTCLNYQWVQNTTYNQSEAWCNARNQEHPYESVWLNIDPLKIVAAKSAANNFLGLMGPSDQSALVSFANTATLDKQLTSNHTSTQSAVNALIPVGATDIGDALRTGFDELKSTRSNDQAVRAMILLTDGKANQPNGSGSGENPSDVHYAESIAAEIGDYGFKIFTIGLGSDGEINETMLQNIANVSGAEYYHSPSQSDLQSIYNSIATKLCAGGSISGCKYSDTDNDGDITDESVKLSDWPIILNNNENQTQLTDADGCYKFSGLNPGEYTISEGTKPGTSSIQTYPAGNSYSITLTQGQNIINKDFGNYLPVCGNNRTDQGEQCDDGNTVNGDGCSGQCLIESTEPFCGDGIKNGSEECDGTDGITAGQSCNNDCIIVNNPVCVAPGSIVINEIMKNPLVTLDTLGEWFEVYNPTGQDINLQNCIIKDNSSDTHTIASSLIVPAGGYSVLARNGDPTVNGGFNANYVYSNFVLGNNNDQVIISCCGQIIDEVDYNTTSFPHLPNGGKSMILKNPSLDNNIGANWCESTSVYGSGDLGTPGTVNDQCSSGSCVASSEVCDSVDNDCDGIVDEGLTSTTTCGIGACASTGQRTCFGGQYTDSCTPGTPAEGEICGNQIDDNCNGQTDENCGGGGGAVCGNSRIESGETCDDGLNNGHYGYCNALCTGTTPGSAISGFKYGDTDGLASTTLDRIGLTGWEIQLFGSSSTSTLIASTTTASNGAFAFSNLAPGEYSLSEVMQSNWTQIAAPTSSIMVLTSQDSINNNFVNFFRGGSGGPSTFCGDGIKQSPNDALLGGPNNDGFEQCDGSSELPAGFVCTQSCTLQSTGSSGGGSSGGNSGGGSSVVLLLNNQTNNFGTTTGNTTAVPENPKVLGETGEPKLSLTKKVNVEFANPGDQDIEYRVKISNIGNLTATKVMLDDVLPDGLVFSDTGQNTKTWDIGDLKAGETKDIVYFVDIKDDATPKTYTNTATAKSLNSDSVVARADLLVKPIKVLAATGFEKTEFAAITALMILLIIASVVLKKRTN
jgi:uncharacterized repeat protein (TIGR01451 family)